MNCFVDAYEFTTLKGAISAAEMDGSGNAGDAVEYKPMFHECAAAACHPRSSGSQSATHSTLPSVSQVGHRAAGDDLSGAQEAHRPVPAVRGGRDGGSGDCVRGVPSGQRGEELLLRGRGAVEERPRARRRDRSVDGRVLHPLNRGNGNSSHHKRRAHPVRRRRLLQCVQPPERFHKLTPPRACRSPGDLIEWCFVSAKGTKAPKMGPRRIGITIASASSPKVIGRALSFAKSGESVDILIKQ